MEKPNIADTKPKKVTLEKGEEQYWCACGLSNNQPFCDGSHRTTNFKPVQFKAEEQGDAYLCMCKRTKNPPYCDGTHAKIKEDKKKEIQTPVSSESTQEEPTLSYIKSLAKDGLSKTGHHGEMAAMGVPIPELPQWKDIQILAAQLATKPLFDNVEVKSSLTIGPNAKKPLQLDVPIFVSDMSFGALSEEAKVSLAKGAEMAGTGICSGEGGMLPTEQAQNSKYLYELGSAMFGFDWDLLKKVQAFHFKGGQGAKTGTGGHLSGDKVVGEIAKVRKLEKGTPAISPPTFEHLKTVKDFKNFADKVREVTGGIPIGFKLSANHIEKDIQFALDASADYIILDGRGGGTGAAPIIFRNNISVPTIPALARARHYLKSQNREDVTLIATGGIRTPDDFIKALCLGADGIAVSNAALQSIGCVAARMCNTNNCPAGIATQKHELRKQIDINKSAKQLSNFFNASTELMKVMARACGHDDLNDFNNNDITTWKKDIADLTGIRYAGVADK